MSRTAAVLSALAVAAVVLVAGVITLGLTTDARDPRTADPSPTAPQAETTDPAEPSERPTETLDEQIERVAGVVSQLRGHEFSEPPDVAIRDAEEVTAFVMGQLDDLDPDDIERDTRLLVALHALEPGADLVEMVGAALGEQVAGYYDPETGELVVRATPDGRRLGRVDELTLAHELDHALTDAVLGLPDLEAFESHEADTATAQQALVEGDATLLMQQYLQEAFTSIDQMLLAGEIAEAAGATEVLESMPWIVQRGLLFPYQEGATFVAALHADGGWAAVDAAYRDPPTDTAQVLFPQRYLAGRSAGQPELVGEPGAGWQGLGEVSVGAADLLALFEAPGDRQDAALDDPLAAVRAWDGGRAGVFSDRERTAVGISLLDTGGLCDAMDRWYALADPDAVRAPRDGATTFDGEAQDAVLVCGEGSVRLGLAPDLATATRLVAPAG